MTKDLVLAILKNSQGYISGEKISKSLNISRCAVNKAICALRKDGYIIMSSTNKGYFLQNQSERFNLGEILTLLPLSYAKRIIFLDTIDSTNSFLQKKHPNLEDGTFVIANEQTNGRGRLGRSFDSPKGKGLYISLLLRPDCVGENLTEITCRTAKAVSDAIEKVSGIRPGVKWVNDLMVNRKKICGILTEMSIEGESKTVRNAIIGIGINCNHDKTDFSEGVREFASSLYIESGKRTNMSFLAAEIIKSLDKLRKDFPNNKEEYLSFYRNNCITLGKEIRTIRKGEELTGTAEGIEDDFGLRVRLSDGKNLVINSGEVSVRGTDGYV
ncbi:MAG: Bifunctional ligase/repressor BirA [Firmicutes bacterium ADurb.Bin300]|nr:MAG: Bifunctional ligase/repressor BirA [Firmicutes bacterium ADurb.Bin300]